MKGRTNYCPVVGQCSYESITITPNSYFLIQPFDKEKDDRENAIKNALDEFHGKENYFLRKSDEQIKDSGIYCNICSKIKKSQYCIVDISGESFKVVDELTGSIQSKLFLRPNVALELGMSYAFNKSVLLISRKIGEDRLIPSDLDFVHRINISPKNEKVWDEVSNSLLNHLRKMESNIPVKKASTLDERQLFEPLQKLLESYLHLKRKLLLLKDKKFRLVEISYRNGDLVAIIKDSKNLIEGVQFEFYSSKRGYEDLAAILEIYHVQPNGIAQAHVRSKDLVSPIIEDIVQCCSKVDGRFIPENHRLELIIPKPVEAIDEQIIEEMLSNLFLIKEKVCLWN